MNTKQKTVHTSVLLKESIEGLNLKKDSIVIDATFGGGGHSIEILKNYPNVKIIAIDQDKSAWNRAKDKFKNLEDRIIFVNGNFRDIENILKNLKIKNVDGVLLDLGLSGDQLDNSGRGFSFLKNEPLIMTMKDSPKKDDITAKDIVNNWSQESLADIIYGYGEERFARRIAKIIVETRKNKSIDNTFELVDIIKKAVPFKYIKGKIHFATRTFQALRIAVNDELNILKTGLEKSFNILKKGGRISVISFHSLEDRIVKNFFKDKVKTDSAIFLSVGGKKPIIASRAEIKLNNRSRSAKLRILEKI